jgi:uncharacterized RDD family membrane protein YckC
MKEIHGVPLASFTRRAMAIVLDFMFAFLLFIVVVIPGGMLADWLGFGNGDISLKFNFEDWYSLVVLVAYFALTTYWGRGQTPGKRMMGIRVVSLVHSRLSLWHSIERALGYGASMLEFGFGFAQYFIHPNRRTVHDRIAETVVVRAPRKPRPDRGRPESTRDGPSSRSK